MLTPKFSITQDEKFVIVTLHVPHVKISESEMFIEGSEFKFYLKPYYLRLNFNNEVIENGQEHAQYDVNSGDIIVNIPKRTPGEQFTDLGMISKLLAPNHTCKPKIEVVGSDTSGAEPFLSVPEDFTWEWDQEYPVDDPSNSIHVAYGFCDRYNNFYEPFLNEYPDLLDLKSPDQTPYSHRKSLLEINLLESFDMEHYLSDFMDMNEFVGDVIHYQPRYKSNPTSFTCVEDEQQLLCTLPYNQVHLEKKQMKRTLIGLVDILFSFVFDHLTNCGEVSVESGWNICKLSSQLSWLYSPTSLRESLLLSFSRALTFPLYRHFDFCIRVLEDLKFIVSQGRPLILKCLLGVYDIFRKHEFYYLHNNTFIKDYCLWIQSTDERSIRKLMDALNNLSLISKSDLPFPLEDFESYIELNECESSTATDSSCYTSSSTSEYTSSESESEDSSRYVQEVLVCQKENENDDINMSCLSSAIENVSLSDKESVNEEKPHRPLIEELD